MDSSKKYVIIPSNDPASEWQQAQKAVYAKFAQSFSKYLPDLSGEPVEVRSQLLRTTYFTDGGSPAKVKFYHEYKFWIDGEYAGIHSIRSVKPLLVLGVDIVEAPEPVVIRWDKMKEVIDGLH